MLIFAIFLIFHLKSASSSLFSVLPENFVTREIPNFVSFNDLVHLSQSNKYLRSVTHRYLKSRVCAAWPNLNPEIVDESFCSCILRPCKYFVDYIHKYDRVLPEFYSNAEIFILALISSHHEVLKNTELAIFILDTFMNLDDSLRTSPNNSLIDNFLVKHLLPLHFTNKLIIQRFTSRHKCSRSDLLPVLFHKGHHNFHLCNIFENGLVATNFMIKSLLFILTTMALSSFNLKAENMKLLLVLGILYIADKVSSFIYDNFILIWNI